MFETWLRSDLKKPLNVECLEGAFFSGDNEGNLVGVEVFDDGTPASLSGGVTGYVIRADGVTVMVNGTLSDNKASIVLPASAYTVPGFASIVIKVSTVTVGACVVYVYRSTTDSYFDPGHVVPSLEELLAKIADCEAATEAAMEVANLTVSAETASGTTPTATLSDEGVGSQTHKHITFGLVRGERGYTGATPYFEIGTVERGADADATITGTAEYPVLNLTLPKGDTGATGATPDISIGDVTTGAAGSSASATMTGTAEYPVLNMTIPRGDTGATGATGAVPDITVGNVTTLQPGQNATVTRRSGSPDTAPVFDFGIPKGDPGQAGNVYGNTIEMSSTDSTLVSEAIGEKLDAPATAGTSGQVLTSDGQGGATWQNASGGTVTDVQEDGVSILSSGVANILTMTGADSSTAGTKGLVPAPTAGQQNLVLTGAGSWQVSPGAKLYSVSGTMTGTTLTISDDYITADMKCIMIEIGTPSAFNDKIHVLPANGGVTISCTSFSGSSTVTATLQKVISDPTTATSTEFDVLNNRIGDLTTLTTTARTSAVAAINEVNSGLSTANGNISTLFSKFSTVEDKKVTRIGTYFTERDAFKARRAGNAIVIVSYINITTQIPLGTNFADTGFPLAEGRFLFTSANGSTQCMVTCSQGKLNPTDSTMATGFYYVVGCAVTPI